jgi:hypothetical protein
VSITELGAAAQGEPHAGRKIAPQVNAAGKIGAGADRKVPEEIVIEARGAQLEVNLHFSIDGSIRTPFALTRGNGSSMDFLQLSGAYRVTGHAGGRSFDFTARGAAETFRPGAAAAGATSRRP